MRKSDKNRKGESERKKEIKRERGKENFLSEDMFGLMDKGQAPRSLGKKVVTYQKSDQVIRGADSIDPLQLVTLMVSSATKLVLYLNSIT